MHKEKRSTDWEFEIRWQFFKYQKWRYTKSENYMENRRKRSRTKVRNYLNSLEKMWFLIQQKHRLSSYYILSFGLWKGTSDDTTDDTTKDTTDQTTDDTTKDTTPNNDKKEKTNNNDKKEILSKDNTAKADDGFWNKDVNWIISKMKEFCNEIGLQYMPWFKEREFAKHILSKKLATEIEKYNMGLEEFIKNILKVSCQPYMKQVNTPQLFYTNWGQVINASKTKIEAIKQETKKVTYLS